MQIHQELKVHQDQQWEVWVNGKVIQFDSYETARHYYSKLYSKTKVSLVCHIT